jgi:transposase
MKNTVYVGLDVHAETITIAVAEGDQRTRARSVGTIPNRLDSTRKALKKLGPKTQLRVCYEAGPCGYALYWQLEKLGIACEVVAPTLVPVRAGDRIKTDKRDAVKLAQCYRAGELTVVWVPDRAHEALRDLVRAREAAKKDETRARHRLSKFLLRLGRRPPSGVRVWTVKHRRWLEQQEFEHVAQKAAFLDYLGEIEHAEERLKRLETALDDAIEAAPKRMSELIASLQSLRGVAKITAATIVSEVGTFERFRTARELMAYVGVVPSEHSSGGKTRRGGITKTGNSKIRRVLGEAAWCARLQPRRSQALKKRQEGQSAEILEISWKAQHRVHRRFGRLRARGKPHQVVVTAAARELAGFVWAVGRQRELELAS